MNRHTAEKKATKNEVQRVHDPCKFVIIIIKNKKTKKKKIDNSTQHSLYISNAAAKTTTAADPATVNLFKAAAPFPAFPAGVGASDGGVEIDEGVTVGVLAGDSEVAGGGELTAAAGEGEGPLTTGAGGDGNGEFVEGETAGEGEAEVFGGVATGDFFGEDAGDDAGD